MTNIDAWNWISAFIQSFAETFLLVNVYCAFLGQPRIKKCITYVLVGLFAALYCIFINIFILPTYLRYFFDFLCVFCILHSVERLHLEKTVRCMCGLNNQYACFFHCILAG